jgi:hypothetical protein
MIQMDDANTVSMEVEVQKKSARKEFHLMEVIYSYQVSEMESQLDSPLLLDLSQNLVDSVCQIKVEITNKKDYEIGATSCVLSLPSGYDLKLSDLEKKVEAGEIVFYSLLRNGSELRVCFDGLKEKETKTLWIDLLKKFEVRQQVPLSGVAYIDYAKDDSIVFKRIK